MPLLYCYYGDDFTGSTDVLEQLAVNGVSSVLFLGTPTPAQLARFSDCQAIGFAGDARSRTPEWMNEHLPAIFTRMRELAPADRAIQGLFHLRLGASPRQHRACA